MTLSEELVTIVTVLWGVKVSESELQSLYQDMTTLLASARGAFDPLLDSAPVPLPFDPRWES